MHADPIEDFLATLDAEVAAGTLQRLVLAKPRESGADVLRVTVRPVALKGAPHLSFVATHRTRDLTHNALPAAGLQQVRDRLGREFGHAHLFGACGEWQLLVSKKGHATLRRSPATGHAALPSGAGSATPAGIDAGPAHDRPKHRVVDPTRAFLTELGVTTRDHQVVPAMARKWKQINKFVELVDHALQGTALASRSRINVVDFGSGKGYLTFALHDHLRHTLGLPAEVAGVELRPDMVALCNAAVKRLGLQGLHFEQGDVRERATESVDIMIALHACDIATDHALHAGVRAGASIIMCAPCCHKELRPQLLSPHPLRPLLKHGVHLGQQAEMLTDALRAALLEACGYDTQVFEFVSLEHSQKNKMILAVKRTHPAPGDVAWEQVRELKAFYGIRDQCLETLLRADRATAPDRAVVDAT